MTLYTLLTGVPLHQNSFENNTKSAVYAECLPIPNYYGMPRIGTNGVKDCKDACCIAQFYNYRKSNCLALYHTWDDIVQYLYTKSTN